MNAADKGPQKRSALGRGLSALIPGAGVPAAAPNVAHGEPRGPARAQVLSLAIEDVARDERQPRQHFDPVKLEELASSIRQKGVVQPILVRRDGAVYRIIAGERRWRASQLAGLKEVPAIVRETNEKDAFEIALIENLQREDLNPIEEAEGYKRLLEEHDLTQEAVAQRVGKERSSVTNALRLLTLPDDIKQALVEGTLQMGHARAMVGLSADAMKRASAAVMKDKLNVRATEGLVRKLKDEEENGPKPEKPTPNAQVRALTEQLQRTLGTKVRIIDRGGKGRLEIDFFSYADLDRILSKMK